MLLAGGEEEKLLAWNYDLNLKRKILINVTSLIQGKLSSLDRLRCSSVPSTLPCSVGLIPAIPHHLSGDSHYDLKNVLFLNPGLMT